MSCLNETVYVVEDDDQNRIAVAAILRGAGRDVETFSTAEDFLRALPQLLARVGHACAIVDFHLPGGDGLAVARRLMETRANIPMILMSGLDSEWLVAESLALCVTRFLPKPICPRQLSESVEHALLRHGSMARLTEAFHFRQKLAELDERQLRIIRLASRGIPNKRIASQMECSIKTIEKHRRLAYSVLKVTSQAEMARAVLMSELLGILREHHQFGSHAVSTLETSPLTEVVPA